MPRNTNGHLITQNADGIVRHDYLYRISLKALIYNNAGQILVVKEIDRPFWDLPGGGMDYDETIESSLKRELHEEVGYRGDVRYQIFDASDQIYIERLDVYQICFYCRVWPENFDFAPGEEGDDVMFINPDDLQGTGYNATDRAYAAHRQWQQLYSKVAQ